MAKRDLAGAAKDTDVTMDLGTGGNHTSSMPSWKAIFAQIVEPEKADGLALLAEKIKEETMQGTMAAVESQIKTVVETEIAAKISPLQGQLEATIARIFALEEKQNQKSDGGSTCSGAASQSSLTSLPFPSHLVRPALPPSNTGHPKLRPAKPYLLSISGKCPVPLKLIKQKIEERLLTAGIGKNQYDIKGNDDQSAKRHEVLLKKEASGVYRLEGEQYTSMDDFSRELHRKISKNSEGNYWDIEIKNSKGETCSFSINRDSSTRMRITETLCKGAHAYLVKAYPALEPTLLKKFPKRGSLQYGDQPFLRVGICEWGKLTTFWDKGTEPALIAIETDRLEAHLKSLIPSWL